MRPATSLNRLEELALERDRRRAPRSGTNDLAIVTIGQSPDAPASEAYPVQLMDLSIRGARFAGRLPLTRGDVCVVHLPVQNHRVTLLASVAHTAPAGDGRTVFGVDFTCIVQTGRLESAPACIEAAELSRIRAAMLGN
jgi:hypothetical protein